MAQVAPAMSQKKQDDTPRYVSVKIREDALPDIKAAAAIAEQSVQDWLADVALAAAREQLANHVRKPRSRE